jgi:hypothetical protein
MAAMAVILMLVALALFTWSEVIRRPIDRVMLKAGCVIATFYAFYTLYVHG